MAKSTLEKKPDFLSVRVSKSVKSKLEKVAAENDRPLSWVVNRILEKYVNSSRYGKL